VTARKGKRRKQLMHDPQETRGYRKMKEEALDSALRKTLRKRLRTCRKTDYRM